MFKIFSFTAQTNIALFSEERAIACAGASCGVSVHILRAPVFDVSLDCFLGNNFVIRFIFVVAYVT